MYVIWYVRVFLGVRTEEWEARRRPARPTSQREEERTTRPPSFTSSSSATAVSAAAACAPSDRQGRLLQLAEGRTDGGTDADMEESARETGARSAVRPSIRSLKRPSGLSRSHRRRRRRRVTVHGAILPPSLSCLPTADRPSVLSFISFKVARAFDLCRRRRRGRRRRRRGGQ